MGLHSPIQPPEGATAACRDNTPALRQAAGKDGYPVTVPQARKLLAPFVNAKAMAGGYPRSEGVDIRVPGMCARDASVIGVDAIGVTLLDRFTCGSERFPWAEVRRFDVVGMDARGDRNFKRTFALPAAILKAEGDGEAGGVGHV